MMACVLPYLGCSCRFTAFFSLDLIPHLHEDAPQPVLADAPAYPPRRIIPGVAFDELSVTCCEQQRPQERVLEFEANEPGHQVDLDIFPVGSQCDRLAQFLGLPWGAGLADQPTGPGIICLEGLIGVFYAAVPVTVDVDRCLVKV